MIAHALTIVRNELERHLAATFGGNPPHTELGNVADLSGNNNGNGQTRNTILLSVVNIQEERTLKNGPTYVRDDVNLRVRYENPPTMLNLAVLVSATHTQYSDALLALSRALMFFQSHASFTHENVTPESMTNGAPVNDLDRLAEFRLVLNLWSPTMEEVNDMWGMLGGKQFPFALYCLRMLEMTSRALERESGLITEIVNSFPHKDAVS
ncbi:MAG TPA: DUF4255 domain-containing protein [Microthrixaceae bacterium]|nr:DUF4255 domain-containing protein [Microthrixaceae bacterium]